METLAEKLRRLLESNRMSQRKLSELSGIDRGYVSRLVSGKMSNITFETARALARPLGVSPDVLLGKAEHVESPLEHLERLKQSLPMMVPVYGTIHFGERGEPMDYVYFSLGKPAGKNIEAYKAEGECMDPPIKEGDIVFIDKDIAPREGNIVICLSDHEVFCGRLFMDHEKLCVMNKREVTKYYGK